MELIKKIKELLTKKQPRITTTDIVGYNTSFIYIPQYSQLTENERKLVNCYISEMDTTNIENIVSYGNTVYQCANQNTELLLNLLYKMTESQSELELRKMTEQHILEERLNELIRQEELELYKKALKNLEKEATLRTVALQEVQKRKKKDFRPWGIFEKAERLQRKYETEQLEAAIERMKINKKMIEQQIQSITNTMIDSRNNKTIYRYI